MYTPTQNIVYHNYQPNPEGHGPQEWMKRRRERLRLESIKRIKSFLQLPEGDKDLNLANLGIYGLGKRRTLQQFSQFLGVDMVNQIGRPDTVSLVKKCSVTRMHSNPRPP